MRLLLLTTFLFYSLILTSQETSPGFDADYAAALQAKLSEEASQKGISAAVFVPGQGIWVGTHGVANANNDPVTPDMRFCIASNSKALTAALLMVLQDEGLLDLDDAVSDHLPNYDHVDPNITIRQLLTHTSGLFDFINDWTGSTQAEYSQNPNKTWSFDDLISTIGSSPIDPGERYDYSNTNFLLAGMIAEAVTGEPIHDLFASRIFEPLDLDMAYPPADNIFSQPYSNNWNGSSFNLSENNSNGFLSYPSTAGAIWSTAYDMVRWYNGLFTGQLLSPSSQYDMLDNDGHIPYAMGLRMETVYGQSFYYHGGAWGFRSYMLYNLETGISLCILSNDRSGAWVGNLAFDLYDEVIDALPAAPYDIALTDLDVRGNICQLDSALQFTVENKGIENIEQFKAIYELSDGQMDSFEVNLSTPLLAGEEAELSLDLPLLSSQEKHRIKLTLQLETTEDYLVDNSSFSDFYFTDGVGNVLPFQEDMEQTDNFPEQLISLNPNTLLDWKRTTFVAANGEQSLARNNYVDQLYIADYAFELPMLHIASDYTTLEFTYAHTNVNSFQRDDLRVLISRDCGESFETLLSLIDNAFVTAPLTDIIYQAEEDEWEYAFIELHDYAGEDVIIRFVLGNDYGNIAYLDDIYVRELSVSTDELNTTQNISFFPNPAKEHCQISWEEGIQPDQLFLYNVYGQKVRVERLDQSRQYKLKRAGLPAGTYFVSLFEKAQMVGQGTVVFGHL